MSKIKAGTTTTTAYQVEADTTGTLVLQTGSTPTSALTIGTDQSITLAGNLNVAGQNMTPYTGFKNRIINGAMVIDQRNAGASVTSSANGTYFLDRWRNYQTANSKFSVQQSSTAPTGFTKSMLITSLSAYSISAGDIIAMDYRIEGNNVADLAWGTASASPVTLSFWVRSSLTGTFGGALSNSAGNRSYPFSYTVNSANTFEYKTVTIAGDTSGTWLTDTGIGIELFFSLGTGSTYSGTAGSWAGAQYMSATGATSVVGTNGATFYITGVQLEKGSTATPFDFRSYGTELALCQRYYEKSFDDATAPSNGANGTSFSTTVGVACFNAPHRGYFVTGGYGNWNQVQFKVQKRGNPSITIYGNSSGQPFYNGGTGASGGWGAAYGASSSNGGWSMSNDYYSGNALCMTWCHWTASAEL